MSNKPIVSFLPAVSLAVAALLAAGPPAAVAEEADIAAGLALYQRYCQSCHGQRGAGDGRVGKYLKVPPADLTAISERNGGAFPEDRLVKIIDGRNEVRTHGAKEMPIWGEVFGEGVEGDVEAVVDERITALIQVLRWFDGTDSDSAAAAD